MEITNTIINPIITTVNPAVTIGTTIGIMLLCVVVSCLIIHFFDLHNKLENLSKVFVIILAFSPIWGMIIGGVVSCEFIEQEVIVGEERIYEVSVSDSVPFNDIASKYEILSYNGETYTIKEQVMYDEPVPVEN